MKTLFLLLLTCLTVKAADANVSKFKNASLSGYLTLSGQTNRITDSGTALQYNGTAIGGGGESLWTNVSGVIKPVASGSTNVLLFKSGLTDNATNVALIIDTVNAWTAGKPVSVNNTGTNIASITTDASFQGGYNSQWAVDNLVSGGVQYRPIIAVTDVAQDPNAPAGFWGILGSVLDKSNFVFNTVNFEGASIGLANQTTAIAATSAGMTNNATASLASETGGSVAFPGEVGAAYTRFSPPGQSAVLAGVKSSSPSFDISQEGVVSSGDLFRVGNSTTNVFSVDYKGGARVGSVTKAMKSTMSPANGTIVYQTDNTPGFRVYVNGAWLILSTAADP